MKEQDRPEDVPEKKKRLVETNEGEGSPSAARDYEEELEEFKKTSDIEALAEAAARELDAEEASDEKVEKKDEKTDEGEGRAAA